MYKRRKMEGHKYIYKCPNHSQNLNNMRLNNKWCDVTIKVKEKEFRAHKVVLAANLKFFEAMLTNDSYQESKDGIVNMRSLEAVDLEPFINFAYTGEILLTDTNALELFEIANYLAQDDIKEACISFMNEYLEAEDAIKAYELAIAIECPSLKKVAISRIQLHFGRCSETIDYLEFEYENLTDILKDVKDQATEISQGTYFEGILRWILHDGEDRKIYVNDLLCLIDVAKIAANYFNDILRGNDLDREDEWGILKNIMSYYNTCMVEQQKATETTLMVVDYFNSKLECQFYNFEERRWSSLQEVPETNSECHSHGAIMNDKFYHIIKISDGYHMQVFDPTTKQSTTLLSSSSILYWSAVCACSRFVYLCGGMNNDKSASNKIFKYDPQTNSLETLPSMKAGRCRPAAIIYQSCLLVLGGYDGSNELNSVEKYDPHTKTWSDFASLCKPLVHAVATLDGKLYALAGAECEVTSNTVEVYDPAVKCWQPIARMHNHRYKPLVIAIQTGKLLVIGGGCKRSVEVYDPQKDQWKVDEELSAGQQISFAKGGLIATSCINDS